MLQADASCHRTFNIAVNNVGEKKYVPCYWKLCLIDFLDGATKK